MLRLLTLLCLLSGTLTLGNHSAGDDELKELMKRAKKWPASCTSSYPKTSTMCMYSNSTLMVSSGVSQTQQLLIASVHNRYRSSVRPTATNMAKMYWNEALAKIAQKWANTCPTRHDTNKNRLVPGYGVTIGQNMISGKQSMTWTTVISRWNAESSHYTYGKMPSDFGSVVQYTQLMRDMAIRVGCGYARCRSSYHYVCNYALANTIVTRPYVSGPSCSACRSRCTQNLCDCKGILCMNGGTLDQNTCKCKCPNTWGDVYCTRSLVRGSKGPSFMASVILPPCPITTMDAIYCPQYPPFYCEAYSYWPRNCPILCETCLERCPGLTYSCLNGGKLQLSCMCLCMVGFKGLTCEELVVPVVPSPIPVVPLPPPLPCGSVRDAYYCPRYPLHYCRLYLNYGRACPVRCGHCSVIAPVCPPEPAYCWYYARQCHVPTIRRACPRTCRIC